jgi:filamentous hemagglutinin family protein
MRTTFIGLLITLLIRGVHANPAHPSVEAGRAVLSEKGSLLQIETSDLAILNWESFSIQSHETTHFLQPSITSAVLNRVTGSDISQLMGRLEANGKVYLINPNGIIIGKDAVINTAALLASTFQIQTDEFLAQGSLHITGSSPGKIENLGTISSAQGPVALFARHVENKGSIEAPHVTVGSGSEFIVQPNGATKMFIRPDSDSVLTNEGSIEALVVELQSDGANALAINQKGVVQANRISREGGKVFLRSPQGRTEVSGKITAPAGSIQVLGDVVHLVNEAQIDVSDHAGGGIILVGGDFQGNNPEIQNSKLVWAGPDTSLKADALEKGDGGTVILWGDQANFHYGAISAKGGPQGGDGGFVEISGDHLEFRGVVDTLAPKGDVGTLLLDPTDINIAAAVVTTGMFGPCVPPVTYTPGPGSPNDILDTDLLTQLTTCNVVIAASGDLVIPGTITVQSPLDWSANNNNLTLTTTGPLSSVVINQAMTSADGNLTVTAGGGGITIDNNLTTGNGVFTFTTTGDLTLAPTLDIIFTANNGSMHFASTAAISEFTIGQAVGVATGVTTTGGGTVTFQSAGPMNFEGNFVSNTAVTSCSATGSITISPTLSMMAPPPTFFTKGNGYLLLSSNGTINIGTPFNRVGTGPTSLIALGNIRVNAPIDFSMGSGSTVFNAGFDIIANGNITTAGDTFITAGRSAILNSVLYQSISGNFLVNAGINIIFPGVTILIVDSGNATLQAGKSLSVYTQLLISGNPGTSCNLNAAQDINFDGDFLSFIETTMDAGQDIFISSEVFAAIGGNLTCIAGRDFVVPTTVPIQIFGGNFTVVVDNSSGSKAGPGIFNIANNCQITSTTGFINFYASLPDVNFFPATINGIPFSSGNFVCNTAYPNGSPSLPFTVFYKLCPTPFIIPSFGAFQAALASLLNCPSIKGVKERNPSDGKNTPP